MFTVKQAGQRLNLSIGALYKAISCGDLECHRFGTAIRITEEQLTAYLERTRITAEDDLSAVTVFKHL